MLFSLKHFVLSAVGVLALLQFTSARYVPRSDNRLVERSEAYENLNALLERMVMDLDARDDLYDDLYLELQRRGGRGEIKKEPKANPYTKKGGNRPAAPAAAPNRGAALARKALPNNAKITLGKDARTELNNMGLHGKARKSAIKWHKSQVKSHMRQNPDLKGKAHTAVIEHVAHKGGSDPKEKNHITASFRDKNRQDVPNSFNGGKNHHLYVNTASMGGQAKAAWNKNNAEIKGQSHAHQVSVGKTREDGKSSTKGKGKQNPQQNFSKNPEKGFQTKG